MAPVESTAIPWPESLPLPPRKEENTGVPDGVNLVTKASEQTLLATLIRFVDPQFPAPAMPRIFWKGSSRGRLVDCVKPVM